MIICGSSLRPPAAAGPGPLVALAADSGCAGIAVDGDCPLGLILKLAIDARRAGLPLVALSGPQPEAALPAYKRLPFLSAVDDKDERLAAVALGRRLIEVARDVGANAVALDLGIVPLAADEAALRRAFARAELDDDDTPHPRMWRQALAERRARSPAIVDACRAALERLVREGERVGVALHLSLSAGPWQAPTPREASTLLREFTGSNLGLVLDPGRLEILSAWGLPVAAPRLDALVEDARLIRAADAVGLEGDILPGLGEADLGPIGRKTGVPVILVGRADSKTAEVARARVVIEQLQAARSAGPATPAGPSAAS